MTPAIVTTLARARILVRLRRTIRRRTPNVLRETGLVLGVVLAAGSLAIGANVLDDLPSTAVALTIVFAMWGIGWVAGPIQMGRTTCSAPSGSP